MLIDTALARDINQIAMCTPLAIATDSLILLVSFGLRMPVHPWMFWLCSFELYCLIGLTCMIASPLLPTVSTSSCHSLHLPISLCCYCIIELYWLVFLPCIIALHCVFAYTLSLQWVPVYISSPHPHVCLCYFSCRKNDLFVLILCIITCMLPLTLTFVVDTLSASIIVEGSRPCPHPYNTF